ncbi:hypothetical protein PISMIDRAFT_672948 [Pisolithus microcarpus 441]|uniref:Uncharacterized protein n=1 Tax=Pisolithus microcarpus 441 TaxID=765257 RepID=A0A0C9ZRR1_9AGAM|nr:hypothetical protein PISMIDRAFT_672948 [Pisolithus microcarpus 441]
MGGRGFLSPASADWLACSWGVLAEHWRLHAHSSLWAHGRRGFQDADSRP